MSDQLVRERSDSVRRRRGFMAGFRHSDRRFGRPLWVGLLAILVGSATAVSFAPSAAAGLFPTPPAQPPAGALGGNGGCEVSAARTIPNPADPSETVSIFVPAGTGTTPLVGGRCDTARRPVVFFAHGYGSTDPATYRSVINHLVSVGNIVVFASETADIGVSTDYEASYRFVDAGHVAAAAAEPRIDHNRVGYVGHSFGGGMTPWLVQQATSRGWGATALWMAPIAPAVSYAVGTGAIDVPGHTQAVVIGFGSDELADLRLGIDVFKSLTIPDSQKQHVTVRTDVRPGFPTPTVLLADHLTTTDPIIGNADNAMKFYGVFRNLDALESCSLGRGSCATDLSFMGWWSDGLPVRPAISTDDPVDVGPVPAILAECDNSVHNPRWGNCGATHVF